MLTILVPTYNRQHCLKKLFDYYAHSDFKVIVVDGSPSPLDPAQVSSLSPNITYHQDEELDPILRVMKALHLIDTPYASILADDELHLASTLQECIHFLETHKDYSACIGLPIGFRNSPDGGDISTKCIYPEFKSHNVNQNLFLDRLNYHFNSYTCCSIYGVQRTPAFKIALATSNIKTSCIYAPEIAFELTNTILGKIHILQKISWLRNYDNPSMNNKNWNRKLRFHLWYTDPTYQNEKYFWIDELCKILSSYTELPAHDLKISIEQALNVYVKKLPQDRLNRFEVALNHIKSFIKPLFKKKEPYEYVFGGTPHTQTRDDLLQSNSILNLKDFDDAFSVIQKHYPANSNKEQRA